MSMTLIMFISFFALLLIGVPIAYCLGLAPLIAIVLSGSAIDIAITASKMYNSNNSFVLLSLPFFILAGNLMCEGGLSNKLIDFCKSFIGWLPGGISMVATVACFFFSALSGSNAATTAAIGGMMIPEMENNGYDRNLSSAIVAASGTTGQVVPPSTPMIIYASSAGCSVGAMFICGFLPGIVMSLSIMAVSFFVCKKQGIKGVKFNGLKNVAVTFLKAIPALLMPVIILGGIYSGIFTPTEAAVVAAFYSLIVALFIYKGIKVKDLPRIFIDSAKTAATGMAVITGAAMFSYILTIEHIPEKLANFMINTSTNVIIIMFLINIVLLIAGCFITVTSAIVILTPIFLPVVVALGVSPVAFGVIMVVNLSIGSITPPVGGNIFVAQSIAGEKSSIEGIIKKILPYLAVLIVDLLIISLFPNILTTIGTWLGA